MSSSNTPVTSLDEKKNSKNGSVSDRAEDAEMRAQEITEAFETEGEVGDAESLVSIVSPPSETRPASIPAGKPVRIYHPLSASVLSSLMLPSILGVLARLGLLAITDYDGHAIFPLAWVQAAGCLVMGFTLALKEPIGEFYGPLYTGITTGFCGSLTTFSSWQLDVFLSWANSSQFHRDWFRDVIDGLAKTIFTLAISLAAVTLGVHLAHPFRRHWRHISRMKRTARYAFSIISFLAYVATIPAYFRASPAFRHQATAALLFCFPGTLTRYVLSVKATPLWKFFPLGTLIANLLGTALLGAFHILQRTSPSPNACAILQGLMDGYCGCLTTVSTFAVEVGALKTRQSWLYVGVSWGVSQLLLLIILGSSWWAGGVDESNMCSFS